jgi:hypothetical protein
MSSVINETLLAIKAVFEAGVNIFNGGTAVSSSNPLPITSTQFDSKNGYTNNVRATNTAVSAQFARQQIYNAGATDMQITALTVWAATAGTHLYSAYFVENHDASAAVANAKTSFRLGNTASAGIEVYHYASSAAIQTIGIVGSNTSTIIVTPGSSLIFGSGFITIPAGNTLEIAIGTANVAFTINATVTVLPV